MGQIGIDYSKLTKEEPDDPAAGVQQILYVEAPHKSGNAR